MTAERVQAVRRRTNSRALAAQNTTFHLLYQRRQAAVNVVSRKAHMCPPETSHQRTLYETGSVSVLCSTCWIQVVATMMH